MKWITRARPQVDRAAELSTDTPVVGSCLYGFDVGCAVAGVLREPQLQRR